MSWPVWWRKNHSCINFSLSFSDASLLLPFSIWQLLTISQKMAWHDWHHDSWRKKRETTPNKTAVLHCLLLGCDLDVNADEWASLQRIPPVYTACLLAWGKWGANRQMPQASKCQLTVIHFSGASGAKVECDRLFTPPLFDWPLEAVMLRCADEEVASQRLRAFNGNRRIDGGLSRCTNFPNNSVCISLPCLPEKKNKQTNKPYYKKWLFLTSDSKANMVIKPLISGNHLPLNRNTENDCGKYKLINHTIKRKAQPIVYQKTLR